MAVFKLGPYNKVTFTIILQMIKIQKTINHQETMLICALSWTQTVIWNDIIPSNVYVMKESHCAVHYQSRFILLYVFTDNCHGPESRSTEFIQHF